MSKYNVGDKFEIEIAEVFKGAESGNDKYRIKGFDTLVFDDKGLEKTKQIKKAEERAKVGDIVYNDITCQCGTIIQMTENDMPTVIYADGTVGFCFSLKDLTRIEDNKHNIHFEGMFEALKEATDDYLLKIGE